MKKKTEPSRSKKEKQSPKNRKHKTEQRRKDNKRLETMTRKWNCNDVLGCRSSSAAAITDSSSLEGTKISADMDSPTRSTSSPFHKVITVTSSSSDNDISLSAIPKDTNNAVVANDGEKPVVPATEFQLDNNCATKQSVPPAMQRKIGYRICLAKELEHQSTAILWFYPLSGHSLILEEAAPSFRTYKATVICIDRPGIGDTTDLDDNCGKSQNINNPSIARIQRHADDVMTVLRHHKITGVYLFGVCIGHPFAAEVGRRLLEAENEDTTKQRLQNSHAASESTDSNTASAAMPRLRGVALVAPFVSTSCPKSWHIARLGNSVPSFILKGATSAMTKIGASLIPLVVTPSKLRNLIQEEEIEEYGWTDDDFEVVCEIMFKLNEINSSHIKAVEAQLGTDPSWQQVCDDFGKALGYDLNEIEEGEGEGDSGKKKVHEEENSTRRKDIKFSIRACQDDKIAPIESVQWISKRCYGGTEVHMEDKIQSHEVMTFLGGPPRNPILMHQVAKEEWGLLD